MFDKSKNSLIVIVVVAAIIIGVFSSKIFYTLAPGERGVIFMPFSIGLDKEDIKEAGFHVKAPWNDLFVYNVKETKSEETMDVLDKSGLSIQVDISVRFNPVYSKIGYLHEQFGVNYISQLIIPEVRSSVRQIAGRYTAEEIYSTKRSEVEIAIEEEARKTLDANFIDMRALLIRSINLPEQIKNAIENKLKQEQESLAYKFRLTKETSEAERKRIEAEGISAYNNLINQSLTDNILKQRGIEATIELSKSPNTKVIVLGSGDSGLPLILGNN